MTEPSVANSKTFPLYEYCISKLLFHLLFINIIVLLCLLTSIIFLIYVEKFKTNELISSTLTLTFKVVKYILIRELIRNSQEGKCPHCPLGSPTGLNDVKNILPGSSKFNEGTPIIILLCILYDVCVLFATTLKNIK